MKNFFSMALVPVAAAILPMATPQAAEPSTPDSWHVYIAGGSAEQGPGIFRAQLDHETGVVELKGLGIAAENPSYLALHPSKPILYAVGESTSGSLSAFRIEPATGRLSLINSQSSVGAGPCHVAISPSGRFAALANYTGGSVAVLPIHEDGSLGAASSSVQHEGKSVNAQRQEAPHAHCVTFDVAGRFLFANDLGIDKVLVYQYDDGKLKANDPPSAALAPGAGPRHLAMDPSGRHAYCVNELDNTVTVFSYDPDAGRLATVQTVPTLPEGYDGKDNTTAAIRVHPSGRFVYASNRGHDSIAVFAVNERDGSLKPIGHTVTQGKTPRDFNLDPTGRYLLAGNQGSGTVVVFRVDPERGTLEPTGQSIPVPAPSSIVFWAE